MYRARIGRFLDVGSLRNPPAHLVKSHGRFNGVGESRFYCATTLGAAFSEVRSQVGDVVSVMESSFQKITALGIGMDLHSLIGSHPDDFRHALQGRVDMYANAKNMKIEELIQSDMANAYFHRLITSPGNALNHRITGVFSKHLFDQSGYNGIMYPCTVSSELNMRYGAGNIALKSEFVDQFAQHNVCWCI